MDATESMVNRLPVDWIKVAELHREYMRAIQPLIKMKSDIYAMNLPVMIIEPDGNMRSEYRFNEGQVMALESIDAAIKETKKSFFGE